MKLTRLPTGTTNGALVDSESMAAPDAGYTLRAFAPSLRMLIVTPVPNVTFNVGKRTPVLAPTVVTRLCLAAMRVAVPWVVPAALTAVPTDSNTYGVVVTRGL